MDDTAKLRREIRLALAFMEEAQHLALAAPLFWGGSGADKERYRADANANGRSLFDAFLGACAGDGQVTDGGAGRR